MDLPPPRWCPKPGTTPAAGQAPPAGAPLAGARSDGAPPAHPPSGPFVPDAPTDDGWLLDWLDEQPVDRPCPYCRRDLRDDPCDRSVHRCAALGSDGAVCAAPMHDTCLELHASACDACGIARTALCAHHLALAGFLCEGCRQYHGPSCSAPVGRLRFCRACAGERRDRVRVEPGGASRPAGPGRRVLVPIPQTASLLGAARLGNQGLFVRPGAVRWWCGLLFGTRSEVAVAEALEAAGTCFFPLAAARLTADTGARMTREADFLVVQDGVVGILELDGHPHDRRAADDHARDRAFKRHGIWVVDRVPSAEALADPSGVVLRFLGMLRYYRRTA